MPSANDSQLLLSKGGIIIITTLALVRTLKENVSFFWSSDDLTFWTMERHVISSHMIGNLQ